MSKFDKLNPMLLTDFYKTIHHLAYVPKLEYLVSYWTPRMSRIEGIDKVVMFGLQALIKEYLIDAFNDNFFNRPWEEVEAEYKRIIENTMSVQAGDTTEMKKLHELGFLPIEIRAVEEGTRVNIKTPMFEIRNTAPNHEFGWLVNYLETYISVNIWHPMTAATIGYEYRKIANKYYDMTVDNAPVSGAIGDFSMRGMTSIPTAIRSSSGHLLSFTGSATIGAIPWLEEFYNCDCTKEVVGKGVPSLEHSIISSFGRENEFECYRHTLEDVFPKGPISVVSDTYDYFNVLTNFLPKLKDIIMKRDGTTIIRGDSGNICDIICGTLKAEKDYITVDGLTEDKIEEYFKHEAEDTYPWNGTYESYYTVRIGDYLYRITCYHDWEDGEEDEEGYYTNTVGEVSWKKEEMTPEMKGTVEILWDIFGGTTNSKGYKVLDPHIRMIYGDGVTIALAPEIFDRLAKKGYAANNCILGAGSFSYQFHTRDTFSFALKCTNIISSGYERPIFKDPKTDKVKGNNFKKSQKGMCYVYRDGDDVLYTDEHTIEEIEKMEGNLLKPVFKDGKLLTNYSLKEIRDRLHNGKF